MAGVLTLSSYLAAWYADPPRAGMLLCSAQVVPHCPGCASGRAQRPRGRTRRRKPPPLPPSPRSRRNSSRPRRPAGTATSWKVWPTTSRPDDGLMTTARIVSSSARPVATSRICSGLGTLPGTPADGVAGHEHDERDDRQREYKPEITMRARAVGTAEDWRGPAGAELRGAAEPGHEQRHQQHDRGWSRRPGRCRSSRQLAGLRGADSGYADVSVVIGASSGSLVSQRF